MDLLGRRAVLGLLGCLAAATGARAQDSGRFAAEHLSGVQVDVRPLVALGNGPQAEALRADLLAALKQSFADRIAGNGPVLVVRIKGLSINPYVGGGGGRNGFGSGTQSDYLDGEALLVGPRGAVIARHPQLSATPSSAGGAWYDPDSERRRVTAVADHYAGWLRRALATD